MVARMRGRTVAVMKMETGSAILYLMEMWIYIYIYIDGTDMSGDG